ncbi:MAG: hypothetical protein P4L33_08465 [Capsulimonadaceae bacterium]|nr:hypothetical protein [Capsulimonadaceae bacterium]
MKINAYVLGGEPDYAAFSALSYYGIVEKIFVSYDENSIGYGGYPIRVQECLAKLRDIDPENKMVFVGGNYARPGFTPMENETYQRQCTLDIAGEGVDWILQLDTDEVLGNPQAFRACLEKARDAGFKAVDYPARWLYRQLGGGRYLEWCNRFWTISAGYPGPVAVAPGVKVLNGRQCDSESYRVDFRSTNTGSKLLDDRPIHEVVAPEDGIYHFSWTRDEDHLLNKFKTWSHSKDKDWTPDFRRWVWCGKHPYAATLLSPLNRGNMMGKHLRIMDVPSVPFEER